MEGYFEFFVFVFCFVNVVEFLLFVDEFGFVGFGCEVVGIVDVDCKGKCYFFYVVDIVSWWFYVFDVYGEFLVFFFKFFVGFFDIVSKEFFEVVFVVGYFFEGFNCCFVVVKGEFYVIGVFFGEEIVL